MRYAVSVSAHATDDMRQIVRYIAEELRSPEAAVNLYQKFSEAIYSLETMPQKYALVALEELAEKAIRKMIVENYLIFYKIEAKQKKVYIVRVLYQRRNWKDLI